MHMHTHSVRKRRGKGALDMQEPGTAVASGAGWRVSDRGGGTLISVLDAFLNCFPGVCDS